MMCRLLRAGSVLAILVIGTSCTAARIVGRTSLVDEKGASAVPATPGVTVNFINLTGNIDESVLSVQSDPKGGYASPVLPPGKYTVEAMYPGFVIERTSVVLGKHGKKKALFALKKIHESSGKSVREALQENIPSPGEVKIKPPQ